MPYLLILLTLVLASCGQKKTNELSTPGFKSSLEQKTYQTITNKNSVNYFRGKILNSIVEEKFPSTIDVNKINSRDELTHVQMSDRDLTLYTTKERSSAKVVVSYSDRTEVYFLPENVPLEIIAAKLSLMPEADKTFKWLSSNITKTYNGAVLYLVSLNTNDIVQNDQNFYKESYSLGQNFINKDISLQAGKALELNVSYSVLLQDETAQQFAGRGVRCTRDLLEAGACGPCAYTRNVPAGTFSKTAPLPINQLGFSIKIGNQVLALNTFNPIASEESFRIEINSSVYDLRDETEVQLLTTAPAGISKVNSGYNYTGFCSYTSDGVEVGLQRKVEASVSVSVLGRGAEFFKDIL